MTPSHFKPAARISGEPYKPALGPHIIGKGRICGTGDEGQARSPLELVVDATDGFIPLWQPNRVLHWKFNEVSMTYFDNPTESKNALRGIIANAMASWGDAAPIRLKETSDTWDFEVRMSPQDSCNSQGCTLARAFFPDAGRHDLVLYPKLFEQPDDEILDTFIHEIGHIFGLRHFFAKESEQAWPSQIFGTHSKFTIMNYGELSKLTANDRSDLKQLYSSVWSGALNNINGTPITLFKPYHYHI